jgi:leucyl/phenylalanyl-tRNA--protein transferase
MVFLLDEFDDELSFPSPELAEPNGFLAIGGDLSPERLILAYKNGIFPWYNPGEPIMWYSPAPRLVLYPQELKVSSSMKTLFNKKKFQVTYNQCFAEVINQCAQVKRKGQKGTWIGSDIKTAYLQLHDMGIAQSVEVWQQDELVAGLYGLSMGKIFFGESMFTLVSNGSKYGFIHLVKKLAEDNFHLIDCQQETQHLKSLGARLIERSVFMEALRKYID